MVKTGLAMLEEALAAGRRAAAGLLGTAPSDSAGRPSTMDVVAAGEPMAASPEAEAFYRDSLEELSRLGVPFLLAGTYAVCAHTGISRPTKDLDVFCKAGDFPRILGHFRDKGFAIEVEDERWIGKVHHGDQFFDVIFASSNATVVVNEHWFESARQIEVFGAPVRIVAPTELIWSKAFIQSRYRYDGADIAHVILKQHHEIDWRRLLGYMDQYWEVLLMHLLNFRWIYPSEREHIPRWLIDELHERMQHQLAMPPPQVKACRGRMFSRTDYAVDVQQWGFADVAGDGDMRSPS